MNGYLLKTEKDIESVYEPRLELLNDNFLLFYNFPKTIDFIKNCMRFYKIYGYGDSGDYEREYFDYKDYNFSNKGHHYRGIDYDTLNKQLDFDLFELELATTISNLETRFIADLEDKIRQPNFEIPLMTYLKSIQASIDSLYSLDLSKNKIKSLIKIKFLESYARVIENLRDKYFILYEKAFLALKEPTSSEKKTLDADWHFVFVEIITGRIGIIEASKYEHRYYHKEIESDNPSKLGDHIAEAIGRSKNNIRPIVTDSINGGTSKNIFVKKNQKKMLELIGIYGNSMCDFFKKKYEGII